METLLNYIKNYFSYLPSHDSIKLLEEIKYPIFIKSEDKAYFLSETLVSELKEYCKKQGFNISKIIFISLYMTDLKEKYSHIKCSSDSYFCVSSDGKDLTVFVFFGSTCEIK